MISLCDRERRVGVPSVVGQASRLSGLNKRAPPTPAYEQQAAAATEELTTTGPMSSRRKKRRDREHPNPLQPGDIEREYGVPFAGKILDPSQWAQTALKKLPPTGPLDLEAIFGRRAPLIVDIGCGNGRYILSSAVWRTDHDHLGVDILPVVIRYATRRGNQRGLTNLRFAVVDGERLLRDYLPERCAAEIHCYHPQPYDDPPRPEMRMINPMFLMRVHRALRPGGLFFVQTDHRGYWEAMQEILPLFFDFHVRIGRWPDSPRGRTRREILAIRRGLPLFRGWGVAKTDVPSAALGG